MDYITIGYKIGGKTWISEAWNRGTLTRAMIREQSAEYHPDNHPTDAELREELLESEAEIVREQFEDDKNTTPYDELIGILDWTPNGCIHDKQAAEREIFKALVDLDENWIDDTEDEEQLSESTGHMLS